VTVEELERTYEAAYADLHLQGVRDRYGVGEQNYLPPGYAAVFAEMEKEAGISWLGKQVARGLAGTGQALRLAAVSSAGTAAGGAEIAGSLAARKAGKAALKAPGASPWLQAQHQLGSGLVGAGQWAKKNPGAAAMGAGALGLGAAGAGTAAFGAGRLTAPRQPT